MNGVHQMVILTQTKPVLFKYAWHLSGHHTLMDDKCIMPIKRPNCFQVVCLPICNFNLWLSNKDIKLRVLINYQKITHQKLKKCIGKEKDTGKIDNSQLPMGQMVSMIFTAKSIRDIRSKSLLQLLHTHCNTFYHSLFISNNLLFFYFLLTF